MKHKLSTSLGLIVLTIAFAASPAKAQTVAPGPYYANPSWDQKLPVPRSPPVPDSSSCRNGNAAVLDRETGLVWERSPSTLSLYWSNAQSNVTTS